MVAKLAIAQIVHKFRFVRCEKTKVPLKFRTGVVILIAKDVAVGVEKKVANSY